jgi:ankyrin repeat protein
VKFLLEEGANPNSLSDTDRSPLWRASFNSHYEVVSLLLNSGADPDIRDKISGETAYDVAQDETLRDMISAWDRKTTEKLIEIRNRQIMSKIEERIKTTVEREAYAKMQLNKELVGKAEASDIEGIKEILLMVAEEAEKTSSRPR